MDLQITRVKPEEEASYLKYLNLCFNNWGCEEQYRWVFHRDSGAGVADIYLARIDGEVVGGTAVTYRRAQNAQGRECRLATMTGSWVLPSARRKGCFSKFVQVMIASAAERDSALLLGFCYKANSSYGRLLAAGFASVDTFYLRDSEEFQPAFEVPPLKSLSVGDRAQELYRAVPPGHLSFLYSPDAWREQYLHGPNPTAYIELPNGALALVEEAFGFLRVLALSVPSPSHYEAVIKALLDKARSRHQRLFLFSMDEEVARLATLQGCEAIPGAFITKIASRGALERWVEGASRVTETELTTPGSSAYLGPFFFHNRDRM